MSHERTRGQRIFLAEPKAVNAPNGICRWCGETLTGARASVRRYCYPDREGRDCVTEFMRSYVWTARDAVIWRGDAVCVDCGSDGPWDADHNVALEDGGAHELSNFVRRCKPCHRAKTARENSERARRRRGEPEPQDWDQLSLEAA